MYKLCADARSNAYAFANDNGYTLVPETNDMASAYETMYFENLENPAMNRTNGTPMYRYTIMAFMMEDTKNLFDICPLTDRMMNEGMLRDWLALCFAGSLSLFFGVLWLYKEMILFAFICEMVALPSYTAAVIYVYYHQPMGSVFYTWWYATLCVVQFFIGWAAMYLYAYLKYDLETRAREEEIKLVQGKMVFPRQTDSIRAYPCNCKLWDKDKENVIKRYDNMHQIDIRANILCPKCKNRIDFIQM